MGEDGNLRPKGTRDLFGRELACIRRVEEVMRRIFVRWGYREVETPIFESLELFTRKSGEEVVRQLYVFRDKSGKELALRPELTAPVVRLYLEKFRSESKPVKLFYFGPCFRYEEPQAHRWRQFRQAGVEILGSPRPEADAEVLALTHEVFRELGLRGEFRVGNVRLLRLVLEKMGVKGEEAERILRAVDSRDPERLERELAGRKGREEFEELVGLRGGEEVLDRAKVGEEEREILEGMRRILRLAERMGARGLSVDLSIARGLEYYTDCVFEVYVEGVQVAGGGRYDGLAEALGGEPCQAVGVGFGVDRIAQFLLEREGIEEEKLCCAVLPASQEMLEKALEVTTELRREGISTEVDLMGRNLSKALAHANARGAKYAVIVGPREWERGSVMLRDMRTGEQQEVRREELIQRLRKTCNRDG
ncbi:MAG: histidine--tRNA ligase [Candidatus Hadarchaeales archaeon]